MTLLVLFASFLSGMGVILEVHPQLYTPDSPKITAQPIPDRPYYFFVQKHQIHISLNAYRGGYGSDAMPRLSSAKSYSESLGRSSASAH